MFPVEKGIFPLGTPSVLLRSQNPSSSSLLIQLVPHVHMGLIRSPVSRCSLVCHREHLFFCFQACDLYPVSCICPLSLLSRPFSSLYFLNELLSFASLLLQHTWLPTIVIMGYTARGGARNHVPCPRPCSELRGSNG